MNASMTGSITQKNKLSGSVQTNGAFSANITSPEEIDVTKIKQYLTHFEFPNLGMEDRLYIASEENKSYRWDSATGKYYCIGSDYNEIEVITGGNAAEEE